MNSVSNNGVLKIKRAGLLSTLQDSGRPGLRYLGIPWSGTSCPAWQAIANKLAGNDLNAPVIECFEGGLQVQAQSCDIRIAIVGRESSTIVFESQGVIKPLRINRSITLLNGDTLTISSTGDARMLVMAVADIAIPEHLGSASTYTKASLGGLYGKPLEPGDELPLHNVIPQKHQQQPELQCTLPQQLTYNATLLRTIAGPQFAAFSTDGKNTFTTGMFELSTETDRMGARLSGPPVAHLDSTKHDIVSDAIVPGSVQVPGNGQPIVMLNDAHTAGGYPKIATVVSCDLPLLGIQRPGTHFQFTLIDIDEAISAREQQRRLVKSTIESFKPCVRTELDSFTLLQHNLIAGVTDGF